jgi:hypothetical protein
MRLTLRQSLAYLMMLDRIRFGPPSSGTIRTQLGHLHVGEVDPLDLVNGSIDRDQPLREAQNLLSTSVLRSRMKSQFHLIGRPRRTEAEREFVDSDQTPRR